MKASLAPMALVSIAGGLIVSLPDISSAAEVDVVELTAANVAAGLSAGTFTSVDLVNSFQTRITKFEPYYNAFVSFNPNALADAAALDAEYQLTGPRSPLHGVPIVIKEAMDVAGLPSTIGFAPYSSQAGGVDIIPETDAPVVARLRAAGAIILGKTNIPAFSNDGTRTNGSFAPSWAGATFNAVDRDLAPGASSSGTATAVAASFGVLGTAEETGGSIQNPAGAQALVGIKPTFGLVPNVGIAPLAGSTRDVAGPHAKTVYDAAITLDILAGYTPEDPKTVAAIGNLPTGGYTSNLSTTALQGKRIGLFGPGWRENVTLSAETQSLFDQAVADLTAQGAIVVTDPFAGSTFASIGTSDSGYDERGTESVVFDFEKFLERMNFGTGENRIAELNALTGVDPFADDQPLGYLKYFPQVVKSLENPDVPPDLSSFAALREQYLDAFNAVMDSLGLDAVVLPQSFNKTPPVFSEESIDGSTVSEINILGTPGVNVPASYYEDGTPFSIMFTGRLFDEADLLGFAYDYEQATLHRVAPTLVPLPATVWAGLTTLGMSWVVACVRRRRQS